MLSILAHCPMPNVIISVHPLELFYATLNSGLLSPECFDVVVVSGADATVVVRKTVPQGRCTTVKG